LWVSLGYMGHLDRRSKRFLKETYIASFIVLVLISLPLLELSKSVCESFDVGGLLSIGVLKSIEETVDRFFSKGCRYGVIWALMGAKYIPISALFYFLVRSGWLNPIALIFGLLLAHVVVIVRALVIRNGT